MLQGVIRIKRKGDGTKGLSRCFMVFSELLLKLEQSRSVCLSYVETQTESRQQQSSTAFWFLKSSKPSSSHRKSHTVTSLQHLDQGSTSSEELDALELVLTHQDVQIAPCVGHQNPLRKFLDFCLYKIFAFSFFIFFSPSVSNFVDHLLRETAYLGWVCIPGEDSTPRTQKTFNSSEQMCAILVHVRVWSNSQKSPFLCQFSITLFKRKTCLGKCLTL